MGTIESLQRCEMVELSQGWSEIRWTNWNHRWIDEWRDIKTIISSPFFLTFATMSDLPPDPFTLWQTDFIDANLLQGINNAVQAELSLREY